MRSFLVKMVGEVGADSLNSLVASDPDLAAAAAARVVAAWLSEMKEGSHPWMVPGILGWYVARLDRVYWWDLAGARGHGDADEAAAALLVGFGMMPARLSGRQLARLSATIDALLAEARTLVEHG
jgi:hypothetical protein